MPISRRNVLSASASGAGLVAASAVLALAQSSAPADAGKHDGMVWFYSYAKQAVTLVT